MKHVKLSIAAASALLIAQVIGCTTTGMSRNERPGLDQSAYVASLMVTPDGADGPVKQAVFSAPRRVAVAQIGEVAPPQKFTDKLRKSDLFSDVVTLPAGQVAPVRVSRGPSGEVEYADRPQEHLTTLRNLAQSVGADYLLLIGGTVESDTRATALSVFNVTVIGMFVVPSDLTSGELKASAAMIDAKTGQIAYLSSAQKSGSVMTTYAGNSAAPARLARKLRNEAAGKLAEAVILDGKRQAMTTATDAHHELLAGNRGQRIAAVPRFLAQ